MSAGASLYSVAHHMEDDRLYVSDQRSYTCAMLDVFVTAPYHCECQHPTSDLSALLPIAAQQQLH